MINPKQLRVFVIRPALKRINLWSLPAETLVLGTFMVESDLSQLDQGNDLTPGPAYGLGQMEMKTYQDIWENFLVYDKDLYSSVLRLTPWATRPPIEELYGNLFFAAAMTRVHYRRVKEPLPAPSDSVAMARYWKTYYNTVGGKGDLASVSVQMNFSQACA